MNEHAVAIAHGSQLVQELARQDTTAATVVRVLDAHEASARTVRVGRVGHQRLELVQIECAVRFVSDLLHVYVANLLLRKCVV